MENRRRVSFIQYAIYPFTMAFAVVLFFVLFPLDEKHLLAVYVPLVFGIMVIVVSEKILPYRSAWRPDAKDIKNDAGYLVLVQTILPYFLVWLTTLFLVRYIKGHDLAILKLWPRDAPVWAQEILLILVSDLFRYWLHRLNHTIPFLWRLHAVHHSVDKIYWLNTSRFHPLEKAMQFMMDAFPFILLGVNEQVFALHVILYGVNGFFQHSNIDLRFGWLNYVVSSSELHRWHHSRKVSESNNNYGNNVIIWDLVFGSFYHPSGKEVEELGLINKNYPKGLGGQMKAPLVNKYDKIDLPDISLWHMFLNFLLSLKITTIRLGTYKEFLEETETCDKVQEALLMKMIRKNQNTLFGKQYSFEKINSYDDYKRLVPVQTYDSLSPYIKQQAADGNCKALIADDIVMFNKTSGTTAEPKLIPVTSETLKGLKLSQQLMVYMQYKADPRAYHGKIVGIASPAEEGVSEYGIPIGSASGHFYKNVSAIVRTKYVIPYEVLEITDYELKYYVILLFCLMHKDITYIATANPTTLLKLAEILKARKTDLLHDLKSGTIKDGNAQTIPSLSKILPKIKPGKGRIKELETLFHSGSNLTLKQVWPYIKMISTWTGGSCGIALRSVLEKMPENVHVIDLGFLASEIRCTVTFEDDTQSGLPTFQNNFFEFVERQAYEAGTEDFRMLHQLEEGKEYYIFVTTPAGLYRYNMNDVITVCGSINLCPLIRFVQKGKGVCNITGEKLYESQLLEAMTELELNSNFIQVLANEETTQYEFFIEGDEEDPVDMEKLRSRLDQLICKQNIEYKEKRASGRLKPIAIHELKTGTFESVKKAAIKKGQSEGQYKTLLLQYKKNVAYDLMQFVK